MATLHSSTGREGTEGVALPPPQKGQSLIIFHHIPKCAGSTLRHEVFEQYIPENEIYIIGDDIPGDLERLNGKSQKELEKVSLVFGHICVGSFDVPRSEKITVLRHPVTRVKSLYEYIKRSRGHHLHRFVRNMSFTDFLLSGVTSTADNAMVRQLCGQDRMQREPYNDMLIPFGEVTTEHLEQAKENLAGFALYGIQEDFDLFLQRLCMLYDWRIPSVGRRNANPSSARDRMSFQTWTMAEQLNHLDMELYQWAVNYI